MKEKKKFRMNKQINPWQKDLLSMINKKVNITRNGKAVFKGAILLNVNLRTEKDFKILTKEGVRRTLIGGDYDIEEVDEDCPESISTERKCYKVKI